MANEELTRSQYLRALSEQRRLLNANNSVYVNPSVTNQVDIQQTNPVIATDFSFANNMALKQKEEEIKEIEQSEGQTQEKKNENIFSKIAGFTSELWSKVVGGFYGAIEGVADLGATALGAITGNEKYTDWAKKDLASSFAEWDKDYGFHHLNTMINMFNGKFWTPEYWQSKYGGLNDVFNGSYTSNGEAYNYADNVLESMGGVGEFLGGAAQAVGFMLPSIITGNIAGSAAGALGAAEKVASIAGQAASLASMGISATGKGAEEALNEGATAKQALAYGAASGAVEVASEIVVGKALGLAGLGTGKVMGVFGKGAGKTTAKLGSTLFAKELGKTMFEEGMEEVFSAVMEPVTKAIYKGNAAFKDENGNNIYLSPDFWFGADGHFNESVLGQFTSGAFVGGLSGGVQDIPTFKKLGSANYKTMHSFQQLVEADAEMSKMEKKANFDANSKAYQEATTAREKAMAEFIENLDSGVANSTESQNQYLALILGDEATFNRAVQEAGDGGIDVAVKDYLDNFKKNYGTHDRAIATSFLNNIQKRYGTDVKLEFDATSDSNGYYDSKTIHINENILKTIGGKVLAHEYFAHALSDYLNQQNIRDFGASLIKTEIGKKIAKDIKTATDENGNLVYPEFKNARSSNRDFQEEVIGHYIQNMLNGKSLASQLHALEKEFQVGGLSKVNKFVDTIVDAFNRNEKFKSPYLMKEYAKSLNKILKAYDSKGIRQIAYKKFVKATLTEKEKGIYKEYKNIIDLIKNNVSSELQGMQTKLEPHVAYSKDLSKVTTDAEGSPLTEKQVEFFKDSKARDEAGRLAPVYHASENYGFTEFDERFNDNNYKTKRTVLNLNKSDRKELEKIGVKFVSKIKGEINDFNLDNLDYKKAIHFLGFDTSDIDLNSAVQSEQVREMIEDMLFLKATAAYDKYHGFFFSGNKYVAQSYIDTEYDFLSNAEEEIVNKFNKLNNMTYLNVEEIEEDIKLVAEQMKHGDEISESDIELIKSLLDYNVGEEEEEYGEWIFKPETEELYARFQNTITGEIYHSEDILKAMDDVLYGSMQEVNKNNKTYKTYLNLKNPLIVEGNGSNWDSIGTEQYKETLDVLEIAYKKAIKDKIEGLDSISKRNAARVKLLNQNLPKGWKFLLETNETDGEFEVKFENPYYQFNFEGLGGFFGIYQEFKNALKRQPHDTRSITEKAYKEGYDGVIFKDIYDLGGYSEYEDASNIYVAFKPNQIKLVSNQNPTENPDIRYSKDTLVGIYTAGSNKQKIQVKKVANGYDIYENDKVTEHQNISESEVTHLLNSWKAQKVINKKSTKGEASDAIKKARQTMKEIQQKAQKGELKKTESKKTKEQPKPKVSYKVEPSKPVKFSKNDPVYLLDDNGNIFVKTVEKINDREYVVKTRDRATNKITKKTYDSYKKARDSVLKLKNISNSLKDINRAKNIAEKPANKSKAQLKAEQKKQQQVRNAVAQQEVTETKVEDKDQWEGSYVAGDNNLKFSVVKTTSGYDVYEKGKFTHEGRTLKSKVVRENISLKELQDYLVETKARRKASKEAETRREQRQIERANKTVLGKWTLNDGKDEYRVGKSQYEMKIDNTYSAFNLYKNGELFRENAIYQEFLAEQKAEKGKSVITAKADPNKTKYAIFENEQVVKENLTKEEAEKIVKEAVKYQIHHRKKLIKEFNTQEEVRDFMNKMGAEKKVKLNPKAKSDRFYISSNKNIYVENNGEIESKVLTKTENGFKVTTINLSGNGDVWTREFKSENAAKNAIDTFAVKSYKLADIQKYIETAKQIVQETAKEETKAEPKTEKKGKKVTSKGEVEVKATTDSVFKSMQTTEDIIKGVKSYIENSKKAKVKLAFPKNFENFVSKAFTEINSVKTLKVEAKKIYDMLIGTTLRAYEDEVSAWIKVGKLDDLLSAKEKVNLEEEITKLIKNSQNVEAKSEETRPFEVTIERLSNKIVKILSKTKSTRILRGYVDKAKTSVAKNVNTTEESVAKHGIDFLRLLIKDLHAKGGATYSQAGVIENANAIRRMYEIVGNDQNLYPDIPYHPEVIDMLDAIIDSVGETTTLKNGKEINAHMSAKTQSLLIAYAQMVNKLCSEVKTKIVNNYKPSSMQTIKSMRASKYGSRTNIISKMFRKYQRGFVPSYVNLRRMLGGNSRLAQLLTVDYQNAQNSKKVYVGAYTKLINDKLKKLGIKKDFVKRDITINGHELSYGQAMYLYISTKVDANYKAIDESGVKYVDKNDRTIELAGKGNAKVLKQQIEDTLPEKYKKLANFLLDEINDKVKGNYIKWYEATFGKYNDRNEIGAIKENKYWILARAYDSFNSVEKAVHNPMGVFSRSKSRKGNVDNSVMMGDALSAFTTYVDQLGTELFLKPTYREAVAILNTKINNESAVSLIKERLDPQDYKYIKTTMDDMVGALNNTKDIFTGVMSRFSVAKLSLNIGTMFKQFASIFTSNIPMTKSGRAFFMRWSKEFKDEYKTLIEGIKVNEVVRNENGTYELTLNNNEKVTTNKKYEKGDWYQEPIGGLKYRSSNDILRANADTLSNTGEKIAEAGMFGIKAVDRFTINTGVFSLMFIAKNQFDYEIGSKENINFVKEQWHEFELSQIGSGALSKNAIGRGDFGALAKGVFGFLQGANRAAVGSMINKIDLYNRNKGLKKEVLEKAREDAIKAVEEFEETHKNAEGKFETADLTEEQQNEYINLKAEQIDTEVKYDDYIKYEVAGGKAIPVNIASGIIAQGILIALINELMRHIKGKKDWDEWELKEMGVNLALAIGVDWIPFVNAISSMVKGYEVQVPAVEIFKEMGDVLSNMRQGNWETSLRKFAILVGDSTGIPFQTIYDYMYGTVKNFDPATAEKMKSVLYGSSPANATSTLNKYAKKGNEKKTKSMLNIVMDNYRVSTSEEVKQELAKLLIKGKEVLPQQFMTSYEDENGEKVTMTAEQVQTFRSIYNLSDEQVKNLINNETYKSLDDDDKAKCIKKVYSLYYGLGKANITGTYPTAKLAQLLVLTNGNINTANYIIYLNELGKIIASKAKTKKELSIKYINSIKGMKKNEKLLLMFLNGYKIADNQKNLLINYLVKLGVKRKTAKEFIG